jgi:glycosyltransferase involved in cell wall biosynthesis
VLQLIDSLRLGGAERLVLTTARHLDPERFRLVVVALFPLLDFQADLERIGVPVHCLNLRGPYDWHRGLLRLAAILRRERIDILHTHLLYSNFYGRLAGLVARVPRVVTTLHSPEYTYWASNRVRFHIRKFVSGATGRWLNARVLAVSQAVREDHIKHFGPQGIEVLYNYLDPDEFSPPSVEAVTAARSAFGWTSDHFILLNVARLDWEKGQGDLLGAMPDILREIPQARLLLVGEGPKAQALRAAAHSLNLDEAVVFAGKRQDIPALLSLADVFVFPSVVEGLGLALLEAMAASRPVVASSVHGIAEIVQHEVNGLLVAPHDPARIAEAVLRLAFDAGLRHALGEQARQSVERQFSVEVGIPRLESLYLQAARQPR